MLLEYDYEVSEEEAARIKKALHLKRDIEIVHLEIGFRVTPYLSATYYAPEEGGELDVQDFAIIYIASEDGIPIYLHHKDRATLEDILDSGKIDEACFEYAQKCKENETNDNYGY